MHIADSKVTGRDASLCVPEPTQKRCTTTGKGLKQIANALDRERLEAGFFSEQALRLGAPIIKPIISDAPILKLEDQG